jgi:hypothetical protein
VRIRLCSGRAAGLELGGDDLEGMERLRRQQCLAPEVTPDQRAPRLAAEDARPLDAVGGDQVRDLDPERRREPLEGDDAGARTASLHLADEALADARRLGDLLQRAPAELPHRPQVFAQVDRTAVDVTAVSTSPSLI